MYLHTEDLTPAHCKDKFWQVKTKDPVLVFAQDTRISAHCISGCIGCPSGKASRGCHAITLRVDDHLFEGSPQIASKIRGTYLRTRDIAGEHAVYARSRTNETQAFQYGPFPI